LSCKANCHHPKKTRATFSHLAVESKPFAPAAMSYLADYPIGTVGNLLTGVNIKLAEDGEILVKGDNVFKGYWKMEEETRRSFTEDGYFMSGDIGYLDDDGFSPSRTVRKTSSSPRPKYRGKNIAPQKIEGLFLSDPLFAQFIVIGERRKFLSALLTINLDVASHLARANGIPF
jgi:long-chain acyl-CoA synthetase